MARICRTTVALMLLATAVSLAQVGFTRYANARYGFAIDVPAWFVAEDSPANNDGQIFHGDDGATLTVWGANNVTHDTVASTLRAERGQGRRTVAYEAKGPTWFVISWRDAGDIYYEKQFVGPGSSNGFVLSYPEKRRSQYDAIVKRLERSFQPGRLTQPH